MPLSFAFSSANSSAILLTASAVGVFDSADGRNSRRNQVVSLVIEIDHFCLEYVGRLGDGVGSDCIA